MQARRIYDVAVVGGGLAGWIAAVAAQDEGASVALIERSRRSPGWGNSMISGGVLHAVLDDPRSDPDSLVERILDLTDGAADKVVARSWADNAARAVLWIESHDGELSGEPGQAYRAKQFTPVRETVPGLHYRPYGMRRFLATLARRFEEAGGQLIQPARAMKLMSRDGNWVVGLNAGAPEATVEARAVVLADGGFQANPALLRKYVGTDQVKRRATGTGQGDGLKMGLSVGGVAVNTSGFYGHLLALRALSDDELWPYPILDALGSVGIVVGPAGRRLVDETHSGVTTTNAIAWSSDPLGHFVVFDDEAWNAEGRQGVTPANPHLSDHGATVFSAATLDELCRLAGIDQRGLAASTESVLRDATHADPPRARPPKLSVPPFYAIPLVCGVTFTMGGLKVDGCARVLDGADSPIHGLFAAGGTMGGLHGGPRAGYAGGLLEAAVFGLLAGETAARG